MSDTLKEHRVIGIQHVLKEMKNAGLVDDDSLYPNEAIDDVQDEIEKTALRWYKIGARRGASVMIDAFVDGKFEVTVEKDQTGGELIGLVAHVDSVEWEKSLTVSVGNNKRIIEKKKYQLTLNDLRSEYLGFGS